ncbi:hypothetical protein C805_00008 [Eubacterium sp. 14-2]|uniref:tyrosine-type recombinase/integrase n=1 Tax=Eubacterium sp. 14-2 TaxID=1235790 RepID=UPI000340EC42|nr:site-specific integrase [Eubacterium sp. 14-2]EOT29425.1 hypothetical protein C805_00008 [Eubacterium sp. 14-2]
MATAKYKKNYRGEYEARIWDGTFNPDGSKHRKRLVSKKSSADLERQVNRLKNEVENGKYVQKTDIYFTDYAREWLSVKKSVREKNTQAMYHNIIEKHLSFLEDVKLSEIRNHHFQLAVNNALDKPRTCQQIYITFRQIMKMAVTDNYIGSGMFNMICSDINLPKIVRKEKRPLTEIEKSALQKADFSNRERAFIYIIYSCGLRRGEALALSVFDFSFKSDKTTISVTKSLIFDGNAPEIKNMPKTDHGFRELPVPDSTARFLKEYIRGISGTYLFTCRDGSLITHSSYVKMWSSIVSKMNRSAEGTEAFPVITGLTAHIFRHNYCTNLCYKVPAISIKKIAQLMGDTEKMVLDVYNHIMEEKEDPAAVVNDVLAI